MSNVNQLAARVRSAAGSTPSDAVSNELRAYYTIPELLHICEEAQAVVFMRYYLYWLALGTSESQEEWNEGERAMSFMEDSYGLDYLGDIINMCED